jgi:hypothetical protein
MGEPQLRWADDTDTQALCADDPWMEGVRQLLLRLEHNANIAKLFEVSKSASGVGLRMADVLQEGFDFRIDQRGGNTGLALLDVACAAEFARRKLVEEGCDPTRDLWEPELGTEVYGWGLLSESWMVDSRGGWTPEQRAAFEEAQAQRRLHEHPDRIEIRMIHLVCRDGNFWTVMRERGSQPVAVVQKPESLGLNVVGNIPHALGRIVDAIVNNPVPVPARAMRGEGFWRAQGGGR